MNAATLATGQMGAHTVSFPSVLRDGDPTPAVTTVTLTIPLAAVDVEAVLWWLIDSGVRLDELTNPTVAVFYLCEALAHESTHTFTDARAALDEVRPGHPGYELREQVRAVVATLIAPAPAPASWYGRAGRVAHLPSWTGEVAHRTRCGHALSGMDPADPDSRRCAVCVRSADAADAADAVTVAARPVAVMV